MVEQQKLIRPQQPGKCPNTDMRKSLRTISTSNQHDIKLMYVMHQLAINSGDDNPENVRIEIFTLDRLPAAAAGYC